MSRWQNDDSFKMGAVARYWPTDNNDDDYETTELAVTFPHSNACSFSEGSFQRQQEQSKGRLVPCAVEESEISPVDVRLYYTGSSSPLMQAAVVDAPPNVAHTTTLAANGDWSDEMSMAPGRYTRDIVASQIAYSVDCTAVKPRDHHHLANILVSDE